MQIYLPIAEVSVNAFLLLGLGGLVGILSGMFGVGGGFLMTPLLFFIGIPPAVAVATEANQIVASSFSGLLPGVETPPSPLLGSAPEKVSLPLTPPGAGGRLRRCHDGRLSGGQVDIGP